MYMYLDHYDCKPDSCGPLAKCMPDGGCNCEDGYEIPQSHLPTPASFGCVGKYVKLKISNYSIFLAYSYENNV